MSTCIRATISLALLFFISGCGNGDTPSTGGPSETPPQLSEEITNPVTDADGFVDLSALKEVNSVSGLPEVTLSSLPHEKNEIGAKSSLSFHFNQKMNKKSVEESFIIEPKVPGSFDWKENEVIFTPEEEFKPGKKYSVTISTESLNADGKNLPNPYYREFSITDELKVLAIIPSDDSQVRTDTDISIIFNQPIFELGAIDALNNHDFNIQIEPVFPFRYRLAGTNTLQIQGQMPADNFADGIELTQGDDVEHRLPRSTRFQITVPKGFPAVNGATLSEDTKISFSTPQISLRTRNIPLLHPFTPLVLEFSEPVDKQEVQNSTTITPFGRSLPDTKKESPAPGIDHGYPVEPFNERGSSTPEPVLLEQEEENSGDETMEITPEMFEKDTILPFSLPPKEKDTSFIFTYQQQEDGTENMSVIEIMPESGFWDYDQSFSLTVKDGISGTEGNLKTKQGLDTQFATTPFITLESSGENIRNYSKENFVGPNDEIVLFFDQPPVSLRMVKEHLQIKNVPEFSIRYQEKCEDINKWNIETCKKTDDLRRIILSFPKELANNTSYSIDILPGLEALITEDKSRTHLRIDSWAEKKWILPNTIHIPFQTPPQPEILGSFSPPESYKEFCIFTNEPFDATSIKENIHFTPELPKDFFIRVLSVRTGNSFESPSQNLKEREIHNCQHPKYNGKYAIRISALMDFETEYTITVNKKATDIYGQQQEKDASFSHGTGPLQDKDIQISLINDAKIIVPEKTDPIVVYQTQNLPGDLQVDICREKLPQLLEKLPNLYKYYSDNKWIPSPDSCEFFQTVSLPVEFHAWSDTYTEVNLKDILKDDFQKGMYIVAAHHPRVHQTIYERGYSNSEKQKEALIFSSIFVQVTDLSLIAKRDGEKITAWVNSMSDGSPIENAEVFLVNESEKSSLGTTNASGLLQKKRSAHGDTDNYIVKTDTDTLFMPSNWRVGNQYLSLSQVLERAYIFTDRPIYRPGDTVSGKAIIVIDDDEKYFPTQEKTVSLQVRDSHGKTIFQQKEMKLNNMGSGEFSFVLDPKINLGTANIQICGASCSIYPIQIEEYKKPEFEVKAQAEKDDYFQGDTATINIHGEYYFGSPLSNGQGSYTLKRKPYEYDRYTEEEGYIFQEQESFFRPWDAMQAGYDYLPLPYDQIEFLKSDSFLLDKNGDLSLLEIVDLPFQEKITYRNENDSTIDFQEIRSDRFYTAEFNTEDVNKNPVYSSTSFTAHASEQYIGIKPEKWMSQTGKPVPIHVVIADSDGNPLSKAKGKITVIYQEQIEEEKNKKSRWSQKQYHIEEKIIKEAPVTTNAHGKAEVSFTPKESQFGSYRIVAETEDEFKRPQRSSFIMHLFNKNQIDTTQRAEKRIDMYADKDSYQVGDITKVTVFSPLEAKNSTYLLTTERDNIHEVSLVSLENTTLQFPITEDMIPNIHVSLIGQQYGKNLALASGSIDLHIDTKPKELEISVSSDKKIYQPGQEVTLEIETGSPSTEIAIVVIDKANLALFDSAREEILHFFYSTRENLVRTMASLLHLNTEIIIPEKEPEALPRVALQKSLDFNAEIDSAEEIGAETMPTIAMDEGILGESDSGSLSPKKRTEFKDTAYFKAITKADTNGKATVSFPVPDNLTTWSILVIGFDKNYRVGEVKQEITVKKPLLVRPQLPRFIRFGDEIALRANIHNETSSIIKAEVEMNTKNLSLKNDDPITVTIPPKSSVDTQWHVSAKESSIGKDAIITIKASNSRQEDEVEMRIPVKGYATPETVASSGVTSALSHFEKIRLPNSVESSLGYLKITTSATLANYLSSGLNSLVSYPYGCNEQIASKLLGLITYRQATSLPNFEGKLTMPELKDENNKTVTPDQTIANAITILTKNQRYDGSWGYWLGSRQSSAPLTAYILSVFNTLKELGISYDSRVAEDSSRFLIQYLEQKQDLQYTEGQMKSSYQADNRVFILSVLSSVQSKESLLALTDFSLAHKDLLTTYGEIYLLLHLQNIDDHRTVQKQLHKSIQAKMEVDARGMFLSPKTSGWHYSLHNSGHKLTALYLKAIIRNHDPDDILQDDPFIPKMLRWLIRSRKDGQWHDTQATVAALDAFTSYLIHSKEFLADYKASTLIDGKQAETYDVNGDTLFDTHELKVRTTDILSKGDDGLILQFLKKGSKEGSLYYDLVLKYFLPIAKIDAREEGISITREYYKSDDDKQEFPVSGGEIGEVLHGIITISVPDERHFVAVESPIPSGSELINLRLKTSDQTLQNGPVAVPYREYYEKQAYSAREQWGWYSPWVHTEMRDDKLLLFADRLSPGVYTADYFIRITHEGEFAHPPARAEEMYFPEVFGRTEGEVFIGKKE